MISTPLALGLTLITCGDSTSRCADGTPMVVWNAVSADANIAGSAIAELRAMGPDGLRLLVDTHEAELDAWAASFDGGEHPPTPVQLRIAAAVDAVGAQRDNFESRLYWYTDLDRAKQDARQSGRPILSLHLLGRLDEEYSCANSRFFRTAVYSHADVARALRDNYVLYWESVRPIPEITIDFGDGRVIHRTVTGNSCHFVLDADGQPIDAIPGLYGPHAFLDEIEAARSIHNAVAGMNRDARTAALIRWHRKQITSTENRWAADLRSVGALPPRIRPIGGADALAVAPLAMSKAAIELPLVRRVLPAGPSIDPSFDPSFDLLDGATEAETWKQIAALHRERARLDAGGRRLMCKKSGPDTDAMAEKFEASMALDTVRNEYLLHRRIHEWFVDMTKGAPIDADHRALSDRVYAEVFRTPRSDPWLGLVPANTFAALEGDGIRR